MGDIILPRRQADHFRELFDKAKDHLKTNWERAEWALFQVRENYHFLVRGILTPDPTKDRRHPWTHLDDSGIPVDELRGSYPGVDWGRRRRINSIEELLRAGLIPVQRDEIILSSTYPGFLSDEHSSIATLGEDLRSILFSEGHSVTERQQLASARLGQGRFRLDVLKFERSCRVTQVTLQSLLDACHIKPWKYSTDAERLDGENGLMLAPSIHRLFDAGWISFNDDGSLLYSPLADPAVLAALGVPKVVAEPRPFTPKQRTFLAEHRKSFRSVGLRAP